MYFLKKNKNEEVFIVGSDLEIKQINANQNEIKPEMGLGKTMKDQLLILIKEHEILVTDPVHVHYRSNDNELLRLIVLCDKYLALSL